MGPEGISANLIDIALAINICILKYPDLFELLREAGLTTSERAR